MICESTCTINFISKVYFKRLPMFVKVHKGVFAWENALGSVEHTKLHTLASSQRFSRHIDEDLEHFKQHPYCKLMEKDCESILLRAVNQRSNLGDIFGYFTLRESFILKHEPAIAGARGMDYHLDSPRSDEDHETTHILSVIYTLRSADCKNGAISISNRNDGIADLTHPKDTVNYLAKDNSFYAFHGSFVTHGVKPILQGTRYSFVMFFNSHVSRVNVINLWMELHDGDQENSLVCYSCCKIFCSTKSLRDHNKKQHGIKLRSSLHII